MDAPVNDVDEPIAVLRRSVGARLGYCFRTDPNDKFFLWHVRFPGGDENRPEIRSYTSDVMRDIPRWSDRLDDAMRLCEVAGQKGMFFRMTQCVDGTWMSEVLAAMADSVGLVPIGHGTCYAASLAEAICLSFVAVMPEIGQE